MVLFVYFDFFFFQFLTEENKPLHQKLSALKEVLAAMPTENKIVLHQLLRLFEDIFQITPVPLPIWFLSLLLPLPLLSPLFSLLSSLFSLLSSLFSLLSSLFSLLSSLPLSPPNPFPTATLSLSTSSEQKEEAYQEEKEELS